MGVCAVCGRRATRPELRGVWARAKQHEVVIPSSCPPGGSATPWVALVRHSGATHEGCALARSQMPSDRREVKGYSMSATQVQAAAQSTVDARREFVGNRFEGIQLASFDLMKSAGVSDEDATKGAEQVGSFCGIHFPNTAVSDVTVNSKGMSVWTAGEKRTKLPISGTSILFHRAFVYAKLRALGVDIEACKLRD